jgi:hypothetical protein
MLHLIELPEIARDNSSAHEYDRVRRSCARWRDRRPELTRICVSELTAIEGGRIASDFGSTLAVLSSAMGLNGHFEDPAGSK